MQAVILAAGKGSRIQAMSKGLPKCLLEVDGKSLIEHQLSALSDNGINDILVVVGYQADIVRDKIGEKAEYIENTRYEETNSLYSLWLARDWVKGPFILMNSDLIFHPDILYRLLRGDGSALAYDSTSSRGLEQTKVVILQGMVLDLGKDIPSESARGESLGMVRFDAEGSRALFRRIGHIVGNGGADSWAVEGIRSACSEVRLRGINIAGLPWAEIDFPGDLERARKEVGPAIHRSYWKKVIYWRRIRWIIGIFSLAGLIAIGILLANLLAPTPTSWETILPLQNKGQKVQLHFLGKNKTQQWWLTGLGKPPIEVEVEGPEAIQIEARLLLPPGTSEAGRHLVEIRMNDRLIDWQAFKATPQTDARFENYVVGDKDAIHIDVPAGKQILKIGLLVGTTDNMLVRVRRSQIEETQDEEKEMD